MRLYLVQHGEAVPESQDPERPLSARGLRDMQKLGAFLQRAPLPGLRVLHSGKTRARESAEILAAALRALPEPYPGIGPKDAIEPLIEAAHRWEMDTLVVGHLPFLARAVAQLVTGDLECNLVGFQPGSLVCLERDPACAWTLAWMTRPEIL